MVAIAKGARAIMSYAPQTDSNVKPTTGWKNLPYKSVSLSPKYESTQSETITDSRVESSGLVSKATVEGDIGTELSLGTYDDLLAGVAFNDWQDNVLVFGGEIEKMFAFERFQKDIGIAHYFNACMINTFKMSIAEGQLVSADFGVISRGYDEKSDGTVFALNPTAQPFLYKASSLSVQDIKIDGVTTRGVACAKSFDMEVNNNGQSVTCLGSGIYASGIAEMKQAVTGNLTLAYSRGSHDIVKNQITGATVSVEVILTFKDKSGALKGSYVFTLPMIQVTGDIPSGSMNDLLNQQITYRAVEQAITIKRVINT